MAIQAQDGAMKTWAIAAVTFAAGATLAGGVTAARAGAEKEDAITVLCQRHKAVVKQTLEALNNRDKDGDKDRSRDQAVFLALSAMNEVFCAKK
jgi:hypothetical protein